MKLNEANAIVGGLSAPSKMPTFGISLPATECKTGSKLRKVAGSVCSKCYACKGMYAFANVKNALAKRLEALNDPNWVPAMVTLIKGKKKIRETGLFRWHDSGDIQSVAHLAMIAEVARQTPEIMHWLPTKEKRMVAEFERMHTVPANLIIRVSGAMIDGPAPKGREFTSTVTSDPAAATCRAFENNGECGDCRKCWSKEVPNIVYLQH